MKKLICLLGLFSCQQRFSDRPPIHINPNMDVQPKLTAQGESNFFPDGRASRPVIEGTFSRDRNLQNEGVMLGYENGVYLQEIPFKLSLRDLQKGKIIYDSTCAACHGHAGFGDGLVIESGMLPPANFHTEASIRFPVGYIYQAINEGVRNRMPKMIYQIPDETDRWRVVGYVRALQTSQHLSRSDIPPQVLQEKGW